MSFAEANRLFNQDAGPSNATANTTTTTTTAVPGSVLPTTAGARTHSYAPTARSHGDRPTVIDNYHDSFTGAGQPLPASGLDAPHEVGEGDAAVVPEQRPTRRQMEQNPSMLVEIRNPNNNLVDDDEEECQCSLVTGLGRGVRAADERLSGVRFEPVVSHALVHARVLCRVPWHLDPRESQPSEMHRPRADELYMGQVLWGEGVSPDSSVDRTDACADTMGFRADASSSRRCAQRAQRLSLHCLGLGCRLRES